MARPPIDLWGVDAPIQPIEGGHRNAVFRTLDLERDLVFKSTRRTLDAVEWLLPLHDLARQSGLVVPELLESRNGRLVEQNWICEAFVEGHSLPKRDLNRLEPALSVFHAQSVDIPQRPGFYSSQDLLRVDAGGDVDLTSMPGDLAEVCREAWSAVPTEPVAIVHGDLNPDNVLLCRDGRIALIDWDECRRDLVLFDAGHLTAVDSAARRAMLAWEVACSWQLEPDYAERMARLL
ncbi:phosphotransferase [uncultured Hoeflea sp.]|uniref:phosphotransferase enzyme family protein n=1 Tax=uncultured Hoeflea sp. TaxID=538666 RepID=UPI00263819F1|nr:phosphotransferase [uncultured Hoeflea sp.]